MVHFEIQQRFVNGQWENTLIDENDNSVVFSTLVEAEAELQAHFEDLEEAYVSGNIDDFDITQWRIRQVRILPE